MTLDNLKCNVAVEANFIDPAYESESDNSMKPIYNGYTNSSGISDCADPHAKFGEDPFNNFREVPFTLHESAGYNSIYLLVNINEITVNTLLDPGSQAIIFSNRLANILEKLKILSRVLQLTKTSSNITFTIISMIYRWHVLIAPNLEDLIIGLDFLLHYKIDIIFWWCYFHRQFSSEFGFISNWLFQG